MPNDARGHDVPGGGEGLRRSSITDLSLTIRDPRVVSGIAARAQAVTELVNAGQAPSPTNPAFFWRADAGVGLELEVTTNGTVFRSYRGGGISGHAVRMATNFSVANNTITNLPWDPPGLTGGMTMVDNTYFVAPADGRYNVAFGLNFGPSTIGYRSAWVVHQGLRKIQADAPGSSTPTWLNASRVMDCNAGDQVSMQIYQNAGGALDLEKHPAFFLSIDYISPRL